MRFWAFLLVVLVAPEAWAQTPAQPPTPNTQALTQTIIKLTGEAIDWQTQAITLQRQVEDLQKQLADAKAAKEAPKP